MPAAVLARRRPLVRYDDGIDLNFKTGRHYVKAPGAPAQVAPFTSLFPFTGDNKSYYRSANGLLIPSLTNTPRIEYDASGNVLGLLVEGARTNLGLYSNDGTQTDWVKTDCGAAKTATGPDGVANSATTLTATGANATCLQTVTSSSAARAYSAWLKRRTGTGTINMTLDGGSTWTAKTLTTTWTRFDIAQTLANPSFGFRIVTSGDAIDFAYSQLESATFPSSAIPTTTGSVARAADVPVRTVGGEFSATAGTLFVDARTAPVANQLEYVSSFDTGSDSNKLTILRNASASVRGVSQVSSSDQCDIALATVAASTQFRAAFAWAQDDFSGAANGALGTPDTGGNLPSTITTLYLGQRRSGNHIFGHIRRLKYYPYRKSNAELQRMTA